MTPMPPMSDMSASEAPMPEAPETPAGEVLMLTPDSVEGQKDLKQGDPVSLVVQARVESVNPDGSVSVAIDRMDRAPGNPPALGSGERFNSLVDTLSRRKGVTDAKALASYIGRKKLGKKRFQALAAKGRREG